MTDQLEIAALPDASQALRRGLLRLPGNIASLVLSALSAVSWFMAPLNLLNFLTGLKSAAELWAKIVHWCAELHLPAFNLASLLHGCEAALNAAFGPWRRLTAPVRAWLSHLLPAMPHFVTDLLLMALISAPAFLRLVSNFLSAHFNAVRLVGDVDKIIALGEENDPLNTQIHQELYGQHRIDVLQDLIFQRSKEWSEISSRGLQEMVDEVSAGRLIDPDSPEQKAREAASKRAMAAAGASVRVSNLSVMRFHMRESLSLLRFTAILSLIGAAFVGLDYLLQ